MEKTIDEKVLADYNAGIEKDRLRTGLGLIEFERSKELLSEFLPPPPAVIYDIGGGYGEYSWHLAYLGYEVSLLDISETNIKMSHGLSSEYPGTALRRAEVADARSISLPSASADAILFMGPLYHINEKSERLLALSECMRLLAPGGLLFTTAITQYSSLLWATTVFGVKNHLLAEDAFMEMVAHELGTGEHIPPKDSAYRGIGRSHFHSPKALEAELTEAGFADTSIHAVVGAGWLAPDIDALWKDEANRAAIMRSVRLIDKSPDILGLSTHLLAVSRKPNR